MYFNSFALVTAALGIVCSANARVVSERRSATASLKNCPADALSLVNEQVLTSADGKRLTANTYSCADGDSTAYGSEVLPLELAARQNIQLCNPVCFPTCHVFEPSNVPNCTDLINVMQSLNGSNFLAPPGTITLFEAGECSTRLLHSSTQPVDVCFSWLGSVLPLMNECFATPPQNGAECSDGNAQFSFDLTLIFPGALN